MTFWDYLPENFEAEKFEDTIKELSSSNYDMACNFISWIVYVVSKENNSTTLKTLHDLLDAQCDYLNSSNCLMHHCSECGIVIHGDLPHIIKQFVKSEVSRAKQRSKK